MRRFVMPRCRVSAITPIISKNDLNYLEETDRLVLTCTILLTFCNNSDVSMGYYRPQTKLRQGNVFTGVCDSVHRGGVLSQHALQVVSQHALQQVSGGGGVS